MDEPIRLTRASSPGGWDLALDGNDERSLLSGADGLVRAVLGIQGITVRVAVLDRAGKLRPLGERTAAEAPTQGRRRTARRREALDSGRSVVVQLPRGSGLAVGIFPLRARDRVLGVMEVVAPHHLVHEREGSLRTVARQVGRSIRQAHERRRLDRKAHALDAALILAKESASASSPIALVRSFVSFAHYRLALPVAAWLPSDDGRYHLLKVVRGFGASRRRELRMKVGLLPLDGADPTRPDGRSVPDLFGTGVTPVVRRREALIVIFGAPDYLMPIMNVASSISDDAFERLDPTRGRTAEGDELALRFAWAAHEVRGPILGIRASLERLLDEGAASAGGSVILRRSILELQGVGQLLEALLSPGSSSPRRHTLDLVRLTEEAIESAEREVGQRRVRLASLKPAPAFVDGDQIRSAVTNVVRNALIYSPPRSPIQVSVGQDPSEVTVTVHDEGPGIAPADRDRVFRAFVRGSGSSASPPGTGLGLFIARRVIEGHGGRIGLLPSARGTTIEIRLPRSETVRGSAS